MLGKVYVQPHYVRNAVCMAACFAAFAVVDGRSHCCFSSGVSFWFALVALLLSLSSADSRTLLL